MLPKATTLLYEAENKLRRLVHKRVMVCCRIPSPFPFLTQKPQPTLHERRPALHPKRTSHKDQHSTCKLKHLPLIHKRPLKASRSVSGRRRTRPPSASQTAHPPCDGPSESLPAAAVVPYLHLMPCQSGAPLTPQW